MIGFLSRLFGGAQEPEQADLFPPTEPYVPTPEALRAAQEQLDAVEPFRTPRRALATEGMSHE